MTFSLISKSLNFFWSRRALGESGSPPVRTDDLAFENVKERPWLFLWFIVLFGSLEWNILTSISSSMSTFSFSALPNGDKLISFAFEVGEPLM